MSINRLFHWGLLSIALVGTNQLVAKHTEDDFGYQPTNVYVSGGYGVSYVHPEGSSNGWSTAPDGDDSTGLKFAIGYNFSEKWALELAFSDLGEADLVNVLPSQNVLFPDITIDYKVISLMANYNWYETSSGFLFYGKIGASNIRNKANSPIVNYTEQKETLLSIGLGVRYALDERWFLRLEADRISRDANHLTLQLGINL